MRNPKYVDQQVDEIRKEGSEFAGTVREQVIGYIAAGLGVIAGLAWNEAINALIEQLLPLGRNTLIAKFIYAIVITLVVVVLTTYLLRLFKKKETEKKGA